jgi:hypothetical protein
MRTSGLQIDICIQNQASQVVFIWSKGEHTMLFDDYKPNISTSSSTLTIQPVNWVPVKDIHQVVIEAKETSELLVKVLKWRDQASYITVIDLAYHAFTSHLSVTIRYIISFGEDDE